MGSSPTGRTLKDTVATKHLHRTNFREGVFRRDGHKCVMCGVPAKTHKLDAHHVVDRHDMPNGGYVLENGITLCDQPGGCHEKAESFHRGIEAPEGFHPNDLYAKIGSDYDRAFAASEALGENE